MVFRNRPDKNGARIARRLAAGALALGLVTGLVAAVPASKAAASSAGGVDKILVRFKPTVDDAAATAAERSLGASHVGDVADVGVRVLKVPAGAADRVVQGLRNRSDVSFAETDLPATLFTTTPNDYWWPNEWAQVKVGAPQAWDSTKGSSSVTVAVLDTGVDASQPDLQGALVPGWNTLSNTSDTTDNDGHGTNSAGVAVARSNNSIGVASYCWNCSLMPVKVIDSGGAGTFSTVANGITWATDHGARVISMSLGFTTSSSTLQSAVLYAHSHNVVLVAAAGNYGTTAPVYPAAYPEVLGVTGTDGNDQLYSWSSYGSSWVELAAPGCNYTTGKNSWYGSFCGTSSAAPALAGVAGLAASFAPTATNTQIEQALESSAVSVGSVVQYGRVNAAGVLSALGAASGTTGTPPANTAAPAVTGPAQAGQTLSTSSGTWNGTTPMTYAYQWQRCDSSGASCAAVAGATSSNYTLSSADVGSTVRASVTASNSYGSASAVSSSTGVVAAPPTTTTATFSGSLNRKQTSASYAVTVGTGSANASLSFAKASTLTLTVKAANGSTVGTTTGASVLGLVSSLGAGTYTYVVSGTSSASFTLNVTYQNP
jgi:thermitase